MELRVLGPVELHAGGRVLGAGRPQQQVLLAVLAAEAGRLVSAEALTFRMSGQALSKRASQLLHTHITRIRRMLEEGQAEGQAEGGEPVRLVRYARGYTLEIPPHQVDVHRFDYLVRRASLGNHPALERVGVLREALDLWRGEPLAGLSGPWVEATRQIWGKQRLAAVIAWANSVLEAGDPATAVGPLVQELAEHPLSEPLVVVLMRALAATGRAAEALENYAVIRQRLADELGTEPGAELQAIHLAILRGALATPVRTVVLAQLPADVRAFTGRAAELDVLDRMCPATGADPTEVPIVALSGTAGVGKSALAINWAHRVADRFPDGQLYVNLRGFAPEQPMSPGDALAGFLAALGVAGAAIPPEVDARAARYRSAVARRQILILLDNAASSEQVRLLLPGTSSCTVLVTSRDSLAGLVAVQGAHRLDLDLLPEVDALALVRRLIGPRAVQEPAATSALVQRCARLPLAMRVAAELVASRPASTLAEMVEELADQQERLSLLDAGGDPRAAVSAVFSWSVRHLQADAALVFRSLGVHPGDDFDGYGVAALADVGLDAARRTLDRLVRASLIHPTAPGRYGLHDLLRAYAVRLGRQQDPDEDRTAALGRLFAYYFATAEAAVNRLHSDKAWHRCVVPPAATAQPGFTDTDAARRWLETERSCLVAITVHAATHGWPTYAIGLSTVLKPYLDAGGHHADAITIHTYGHQAARRAGNLSGEADTLRGLGMAHMRLGRYGSALDHYGQSLDLARQAEDHFGEVRALNGLGFVEQRLGRFRAAADHHREALRLARRVEDRLGEVRALNGLGFVEQRLGRLGPAVRCHEQALAVARQAGDLASEAISLDHLGLADQRLDRYRAAAVHHGLALDLARKLGNRTGEGYVLHNLGTCHLNLNQHATATGHFQSALVIFREIGGRRGQVFALNGLGEAAYAAGRVTDAITHHTAALAIATDIGIADQRARAETGLGHAHRFLGDADRAWLHYDRALAVYIELQTPDADRVRTHLSALPPALSLEWPPVPGIPFAAGEVAVRPTVPPSP